MPKTHYFGNKSPKSPSAGLRTQTPCFRRLEALPPYLHLHSLTIKCARPLPLNISGWCWCLVIFGQNKA